jgi:putative heme-binding domain-containing protein
MLRRMKLLSILLVTLGVAVTGTGSPAPAAPEPGSSTSRDRYKEDLAGNEDVQRVIQSFEGKGEVGDDSQPTPAEEAVKLFKLADGLKIELVASEPAVEQPLYMHFDDRGRLWVVQYRQYPFPEGLKVIRYDQYLRAVFDKVPQPPPNHVQGRDKITVFEDTDGDGRYDSHKDVITGLNIATSVLTGHRGLWVLNPPYLLFYPDANGDDIPDADPEVRLSGFGLEDTHSVANSLHWGPDGWIYGANGSTTTGNVSSAATKSVRFEGQCIWRYHPDSQVFEIYAEGGGNTFSTEVDAKGRVFSGTNHGSTRGMYYPQGSYGEKNWGKHGPLTNPYAFGFFQHMRHEGDSDRFPQTFVIYEGGALPERYQQTVIAANALHNRVWASELIDDGSTYRTIDMPPVATTPDRWFRPVDLKVGPDGAVYLADWYDTRLTHVDPRDNWHKTSGRVYRISAAKNPGGEAPPRDLSKLSDEELIAQFTASNKWTQQTAVRVLGDRLLCAAKDAAPSPTIEQLKQIALDFKSPASLQALWTIHWAGQFNLDLASKLINHPDEHVRRWTVRLLGDHRRLNDGLGRQLADMAKTEPYVQVRSQLASSSKRFATRYALPILGALSQRQEDLADPHLPLLIWWGYEAHTDDRPAAGPQVATPIASEDLEAPPREQLLAWLEEPAVWEAPIVKDVVLRRLMQRFAMDAVADASAGNASDSTAFDACARLLEMAPSDGHRSVLIAGFLEAYQGREIKNLPPALTAAIEDYQQRIGKSDLALGLRLGKDDAIREALKVVRDESADAGTRLAYLELLGQIGKPQVVSPLLGLLTSRSDAVKRAAMLALINYDDPKIGQTICSRYHSSLPAEHDLRSTAHRVLASRPVWTKQLLAEIEGFRIKPADIPLDIVQQMRLHDDQEIQKLLDKHWGRTRATPEEKQQQIARIRRILAGAASQSSQTETPDPIAGRELFRKHCATCHTLFDEGGQTGPKLTGYERDNLDFMLLAIVDPSAAIREEFTQFQAITADGLVLNGLLDDQTPTTITLRGANNQTTLLDRDDVDVLKAVETSLMPDGLMEKLADQEILNLFAYLTRRTPLPAE